MKIEYDDGKLKWEIQSDLAVTLDHALLRDLLQHVAIFHAKVPLSKFEIKREANGTHRYEFTAKDGRTWKQVLKVTGQQEVSMNFTVGDYWKLSEFALHRPLRDVTVDAILTLKLSVFTAELA